MRSASELRVEPNVRTVRVARIVSCCAAGKIINSKTARSQAIGGIVEGTGNSEVTGIAIVVERLTISRQHGTRSDEYRFCRCRDRSDCLRNLLALRVRRSVQQE